MKRALTILGLAAVLAALVAVFIGHAAPAAEKKSISGTKTTKRVVSREMIYPGDDPRHVMTLLVREDVISSPDPDWNDLEATAYEEGDHGGEAGSHKGYLVVRHKNGDLSYLRYQGSDKIAATADGGWEVSSEGKMQIAGGTGAYKDTKGSGKYKGKTTPKTSVVTWEGTIER